MREQLSVAYGGTNATYDAEGRLVQVAFGGGVAATYEYNAEGRRVKRTEVSSGNVTYFVYDAGERLQSSGNSTGQHPLVVK
jgi:YD repeat-containing protein